jgi:hypothetical protein
LGKAIAQSLDRDVIVEERVLWLGVIDRQDGDLALVTHLSQQLSLAGSTPMMTLCVERPPAATVSGDPATDPPAAAAEAEFEAAVGKLLAEFPRVETAIADEWAFRLARGACPAPKPRAPPPVESLPDEANAVAPATTETSPGGNGAEDSARDRKATPAAKPRPRTK